MEIAHRLSTFRNWTIIPCSGFDVDWTRSYERSCPDQSADLQGRDRSRFREDPSYHAVREADITNKCTKHGKR
jgi:hypothetical protein